MGRQGTGIPGSLRRSCRDLHRTRSSALCGNHQQAVATLGFYSNSVINKLQQEVADRLGALSGYDDYQLFLINSGAEANENALKLASFHNGRTRVISFAKLSTDVLRWQWK